MPYILPKQDFSQSKQIAVFIISSIFDFLKISLMDCRPMKNQHKGKPWAPCWAPLTKGFVIFEGETISKRESVVLSLGATYKRVFVLPF